MQVAIEDRFAKFAHLLAHVFGFILFITTIGVFISTTKAQHDAEHVGYVFLSLGFVAMLFLYVTSSIAICCGLESTYWYSHLGRVIAVLVIGCSAAVFLRVTPHGSSGHGWVAATVICSILYLILDCFAFVRLCMADHFNA